MENDKIKKEDVHYVCLGDCQGVSKYIGVCQTPDCMEYDHDFVQCDCKDGKHKDFNPRNFK